jgi:hypothetical protein
MRDGGREFLTGEPIEAQTFFDDKLDIHHIFPEKWCKTFGIEPGTLRRPLPRLRRRRRAHGDRARALGAAGGARVEGIRRTAEMFRALAEEGRLPEGA